MKDSREFFLPIDGIKLHMKLDFPTQEKEKYPLVMVVHGLTGNMEEQHLLGVADACRRSGCSTLRVELFGHGQSEGRFEDHTMMHWITELMQLIDYAVSLDFVSELYLTGHSQGGAAIILAAGFKPEYIRGLIPLSPAVSLQQVAFTGKWRDMDFDPDDLPRLIPFHEDAFLSDNYFRIWRMMPLKEAIKNYTGPVQIIHGSADDCIEPHWAVDLQKQYKNAQLTIIEGDDHCYNYHLDQVAEAVSDFLLSQLTNP